MDQLDSYSGSVAITSDPFGSLCVISSASRGYCVIDTSTGLGTSKFTVGFHAYGHSAWISSIWRTWVGCELGRDEVASVSVADGEVLWRVDVGGVCAAVGAMEQQNFVVVVTEGAEFILLDRCTGAVLSRRVGVEWVWTLSECGLLLIRESRGVISLLDGSRAIAMANETEAPWGRVLGATYSDRRVVLTWTTGMVSVHDTTNGRLLASTRRFVWLPDPHWCRNTGLVLGFGSLERKVQEDLVVFDTTSGDASRQSIATPDQRESHEGTLADSGRVAILKGGYLLDVAQRSLRSIAICRS